MYTPACVSPGPRPSSWTGKAGAGPFSVDGTIGGEWKNCFQGGNEGRDDPEASDSAVWRKLKQRLKAEGNEIVTIRNGLKMRATDGKMRITDVADTEQLFRLIQSIPSPKAEPFKQWMASVAARRLDQMQDPELDFEQAYADYRRVGYSDKWINQRLRSIEVRKELTDEWDRAGVTEGQQYATLTDIITQGWSGKTTRQYQNHSYARW